MSHYVLKWPLLFRNICCLSQTSMSLKNFFFQYITRGKTSLAIAVKLNKTNKKRIVHNQEVVNILLSVVRNYNFCCHLVLIKPYSFYLNTKSVLFVEAKSAVSLLISADFLKMAPLVQEVLCYLHSNAQDVLASQANLNCLPEKLLNR